MAATTLDPKRLLEAVARAQSRFLLEAPPESVFEEMLEALLGLTGSEYGFIGEIRHDGDRPFLKTFAISNIAWNEATRRFYDANAPQGLEFHNLETLFGAVITTERPVIANDPDTDPRAGGRPDGHPPLRHFLGLPLHAGGELVGEVGIANRDGGYDHDLVRFLQPFTATCANLIFARRAAAGRAAADAERRASERMLQAIVDNSHAAIFVKDRDGRFLLVNSHLEELFGVDRTELLGRSGYDADLFPPDVASRWRANDQEVLRTNRAIEDEEEAVTKEGERRVYLSLKFPLRNDDGAPTGIVGISTDITERQELETRLARAQRLEAVGRLAGGIAHDFNNLLQMLRGHVELLEHDMADRRGGTHVHRIRLATDRATALVDQLLTFARGQDVDGGTVEVDRVVREFGPMLDRLVGERIALRVEPGAAGATAGIGRTQFEQVLVNLVVNAVDALPDGGRIVVTTAATTGAPEPTVLIRVRDDGIGMESEVVARAFDPFFTTKPAGVGTGLGLSTVYGIITGADGDLTIDSHPGVGTVVEISLPAVTDATGLESVGDGPAGAGEQAGAVLVVEDQDEIRDLIGQVLTSRGFRTVLAAGADEALTTLASIDHLDAVVSDVVMPGTSGVELAHAIATTHPDVGVVLMSGFATPELTEELSTLTAARFLQKPFGLVELVDAVTAVVGGGAGEPQPRPLAPGTTR